MNARASRKVSSEAATDDGAPLDFRVWRGSMRAMPRAHRHEDVEANFLPDGEAWYLLGGRRVRVPAGRLALLWAATPHRLTAVTATRVVWATIPLGWLLTWGLPASFTRALLAGALLVDRAPLPDDEAALHRWCADYAKGRRWRDLAAREVEARIRRMALHRPTGARAGRRAAVDDDPARRHAEAMSGLIAARYRDDLGVEDVARHVGLHPHYAMALFRRHVGCSILEHLTRQRVAHVQRLLATTDTPVIEAGYDAGFGSVSRFYAAFAKVTGRSPRAYRRAVRGQ